MLIGRGAERERLQELLLATGEGAPGAVVVVGEPGIGKTALLQEAGEAAAGLGFHVVALTGLPAERAIAGAMLSLLGARLGAAGVVSEEIASLDRAASGSLPTTVYGDLVAALAAAAVSNPMLLIGDDLQWWDAASLDALAFAVRRLRHDPVAVVLAARSDWQPPGGVAALPRLELGPVPRDDAVALARVAVRDVTAEVAERLWEACGGNPLAIVETVRNLPADVRVGRVRVPDHLPVGSGVIERWAAHVDQLPESGQLAITMLAVDTSADAMPFAVALSSAGLRAADLEPAEASGLVVAGGGHWTFRHPLVRHAVLDAVRPAIVRHAHAALAAALSGVDRTGIGRTARAWHLAAAAVAPDAPTAAALAEEAEVLAAQDATVPAAEVFALAAEIAAEPDLAAAWYARAARLATDGYDEPAAVRWADEGLACHPEGAVRGHLLLAKGVALARFADVVRGAEALRESLSYLTGDDRLDAVRGLLFAVDLRPGRAEVVLPLVEELEAAGTLSQADRLLIGHNLTQLQSETDRGLSILTAAFRDLDLEAAVRTGADWEIATNAAMDVGLDISGAAANLWHRRFLDDGNVARRCDALSGHAFLRYWDGDWRATESALDELEELTAAAGLPNLYGDCARLELEARRGHSERFEASFSSAAAVTAESGMWLWSACLPGQRGVLALAQGQLDEAQGLFAETLDAIDWPRIHPNSDPADHAVLRLEALLDLGRRDEAVAVQQYLVDRLGAGTTLGRGFLARAAADLADDDTADSLFRDAERDIERGVHVFMLAGTRLRHARWLRRHRRRREAAELLQSALSTFESLECEPWAEQCRGELRAAGVDVARHERYDPTRALTAQERRVAEAVAAGLSNKEVARRLFLSPRTVEIHLTHVYRKLGLPGRAALCHAFATL